MKTETNTVAATRQKITTRAQLRDLIWDREYESIIIDAENRMIRREYLKNPSRDTDYRLPDDDDRDSSAVLESGNESNILHFGREHFFNCAGFVARWYVDDQPMKVIVEGNGVIARSFGRDLAEERSDIPFWLDTTIEMEDFVHSDNHVPGKIAIQWI